jgi:hypothetical protein
MDSKCLINRCIIVKNVGDINISINFIIFCTHGVKRNKNLLSYKIKLTFQYVYVDVKIFVSEFEYHRE